jgi:hypothetical protein
MNIQICLTAKHSPSHRTLRNRLVKNSQNMPFVIRPPLDSAAADNPSLTYTIIEPDPSEHSILRDLQSWDWRVTRYGFGDEDYIEASKQIERDIKKRRRQTHAIAGELYGYNERLTLEEVWEFEAERILEERAYEEREDLRKNTVIAEDERESRSQKAEKYVSDYRVSLRLHLVVADETKDVASSDRSYSTNERFPGV